MIYFQLSPDLHDLQDRRPYGQPDWSNYAIFPMKYLSTHATRNLDGTSTMVRYTKREIACRPIYKFTHSELQFRIRYIIECLMIGIAASVEMKRDLYTRVAYVLSTGCAVITQFPWD